MYKGPREMMANRPGICTVCGKPFPAGQMFYWQGAGRGRHTWCTESESNQAPAQAPTMGLYLFADRDGKSKFDLLHFGSVAEAATKALELSAENAQPVTVARQDGDRFHALFMVNVVDADRMYPKPEEKGVSIPNIDGVILEMPDGADKIPF